MDAIPYKLYAPNSGGKIDLMPDLSQINSPYTASQYHEVSPQDFMTNYYPQDKAYYDDYFARNTTPGVRQTFQSIVSGNYGPLDSGYRMQNGVLTTQNSIDHQAALTAGATNGSLIPTPVGNSTAYVPTQSPAATQLKALPSQPAPQIPNFPGYELGNNSLIQSGWNQIAPTQNTPTPMLQALSATTGVETSNSPVPLSQRLAAVQTGLGDQSHYIAPNISPLATIQYNYNHPNTGTKISYTG